MDIRPRLTSLIPGLLLIAALLVLALARSMVGTARDGLTIDEPYHYAAGLSYQRFGDYRLNPEHPPLAKRWTAWLAPRTVVMPPLRVIHEKRDERRFVQTAAYLDNTPEATQANIRRAMFAFNLLLLGAIALVVWRVAGLWWAAGMLAWLAVEPTIGAHLPLLMTDLPVALCLGLAAACAAWLATSWRWPAWLAFALACGLALGTKHSALGGLVGIGIGLSVLALWRTRDAAGIRQPAHRLRRLGAILAAAVLAVVLLWAQYGFQFHASPDGSDPFNRPFADKIDDLASPTQRAVLTFADRTHLLPRSYVWGLADTLRAGVEGRGQRNHWLFGHKFKGAPPWFFWPGELAAKIPLPLLAAALLGLLALWRAPLTGAQRRLLVMMAALGLGYWLSLLSSRGTYAGVRHALPMFLPLATLAGALPWRASVSLRGRVWKPLAFAPAALALVMTAREPRLYEYFNELAGGSDQAWRGFTDEGVDLGQRLPEIKAYVAVHKPADAMLYNGYMYMPEWARAEQVPLRRYVESVDDTNVAGHYAGWFLLPMAMTIPEPEFDYDPKKTMAHLKLIKRIGTLGVWTGYIDEPRARASSLYPIVIEEIYEQPKPDWPQIARRCGEIVKLMPFHVGCAVEEGNALARIGDITGARKAWAQARATMPADDPTVVQLLAMEQATASGTLPAQWRPVRNPWME
ncbi:hypothetical protein SAMN05428989_2229 [Pseudoxanthomonas sp. GM95]|uniref:hypothetical protein n=1 Tax=Pseudoxanthomonas sp. GM95 TaxID=1881043 RepID=UPI0008BA88D4|nr:hypothetical protein [Pseudoxanthomonas sp. GM95]SEL68152.1 hypothetical protein SAMN05428989_2229 [Pseudoxanthomonas sp. GM95]